MENPPQDMMPPMLPIQVPTYRQLAADISMMVAKGETAEAAGLTKTMADASRGILAVSVCQFGGYFVLAMYTMALLELNKVWNAATLEERQLIITMKEAVDCNFGKILQ